MKYLHIALGALVLFSSLQVVVEASIKTAQQGLNESQVTQTLLSRYRQEYNSAEEIKLLQEETLKLGGQAVPALIEVMKEGKYPDKNRWVATFLVGQIMGEQSAPFVAKFVEHPSWVMRMASLKTLLALGQGKYGALYSKALSDDSLIVRAQALDNIRELNLKEQAPHVWAMLYDSKNYYQPPAGEDKDKTVHRRTHLIKRVIETVGDLKFEQARDPLFTMIQNDRYNDIFDEMDYALGQILGRKSPDGSRQVKRHFWQRVSLTYKTL
jgi:hypothetical protein